VRWASALREITSQHHVLSHEYFSMLSFKCGPGYVKYCLRPRHEFMPWLADDMETNRTSVRAHMRTHELVFDFCIQVARDPSAHPLEDCSVEWDEDLSPYVPIATLRIPAQDPDSFNGIQNVMTFHPGQCTLPEHVPLGTVNHIRDFLYVPMSRIRIGRLHGKEGGDPVKCPYVDPAVQMAT